MKDLLRCLIGRIGASWKWLLVLGRVRAGWTDELGLWSVDSEMVVGMIVAEEDKMSDWRDRCFLEVTFGSGQSASWWDC